MSGGVTPWESKLKLFTDSRRTEEFMRSCLAAQTLLISGQKTDVSRGCLSGRVAMLQISNALKSTSEGRTPKVCRAAVLLSAGGEKA